MSLLRMFSKQDFDTVMLTEQHIFWSRCRLCNLSFLWFHALQFWVVKKPFSPLPPPTMLPFFTGSPFLSHQAKIVCLFFFLITYSFHHLSFTKHTSALDQQRMPAVLPAFSKGEDFMLSKAVHYTSDTYHIHLQAITAFVMEIFC